ncbi:Ncw1p KNAG_0E02260 [Huiozyma naganishii CBS 8797]|uniref:Uncharacterized protein n=1 Tax=Huiozyma naganishii (strain ATCC MYA-139 / BCRC 22969 / CBS 8797 / KCTC 17520 / NBRC 10181 / NCYC 3082 / Yp74L-3) TaxID=1071383 RepID=J7RZ75_HUIN7|nr:hypothetical protein KNAG_0E02260 [Kazachstania naganishii CBS 8797]CCK70487.1 hypothetical protein KNAG_0E02260 [Kazachstania naganishii CBS 8797]
MAVAEAQWAVSWITANYINWRYVGLFREPLRSTIALLSSVQLHPTQTNTSKLQRKKKMSSASIRTNSALVSNQVVAASSVSNSIRTNSALVSADVVAASSVRASASGSSSRSSSRSSEASRSASRSASSSASSTSARASKNAAAMGLVANPISWKYGVAMAGAIVGSFVLGAGI